jgi:uncharacterized protein (DUF427 family)
MKAVWNDQVIAEAPKEELVYIEGNWYFPPESVKKELLVPSDTRTTCHWKGEASYYTITANGEQNEDAAWYYPEPKEGSTEIVKKDYKDYVAFWRGVVVAE